MLSFPMPITQFAKQSNEVWIWGNREGGGWGTGRGGGGGGEQEQKRRKRKTNALLAEQACYSQTGNSAFGANLKPYRTNVENRVSS